MTRFSGLDISGEKRGEKILCMFSDFYLIFGCLIMKHYIDAPSDASKVCLNERLYTLTATLYSNYYSNSGGACS